MHSLRHSCSIFLLLLPHFLITAVNCLEGSYFFYQQPEYPRDCKEVYTQCSSDNSSGVYTIKPDGYPKPFEVYCDNQISTGGWTVIQRQIDGSLTFKRTWEDYRNGFGFLSGEFYIGNDKLSHLTNQAVYELRIDMMLSNGSFFYIRYSEFRISDEWSHYTLVNAEGFSGNSSCVATSCPIEMVHESCACQTSCTDPVRMTGCYEICEETCVPQRCFVNEANDFILEGESYSDPACTKRCSCTNGQLLCNNNYRCDVNAACERRSEYHKCYCNPGYSGNGVNCTSICPTNEVYGTCTCQKSCSNPTSCVSCTGDQRCYCPNGFYLQGGNCVPQERCGCYFDGRILLNGDTYVNSDCSRRCTCNNDQLNCDSSYRCTSNAACRVRDGVRKCYCNAGYEGDGITSCTRPYTDCNDVQNAGITQSGVYPIRPTGWTGSPFNVFCNMTIDGGGWTVIQRRINGATNFYRSWADYKNGFGNIQQEFWLGNEKLYYLTQQATYEYRFDFVMSSYATRYHKYSRFRIDNESNKYRVTDVGSRSGDAGYTLYNTQNIAFSTYDRDNDGKSATDCAEEHRSGWWHGGYYYSYSYSYCYYFPEGSRYRYCSYANPNGVYNGGNGQNIFTYYYSNYCHTKYTEMKIRRIS
ncbi:Fibrinogen-like protein 1 [Holothuria leucospilota]|uniref:Fibrinogen-like protein 1 n=1 Tax=Holothuria leucospilota TaxID=206669 RepID=A0A9Q0YAL2_HOLLE|nr:Fibrinogen-like protein 1 [Holothuria leucospilota]